MTARFEIVHTDATQPWHARWVAANGEIVWVTENYANKADAETSVFMISGARLEGEGLNTRIIATLEPQYPVHYVDERKVEHDPNTPGLFRLREATTPLPGEVPDPYKDTP
jgi:uncharacterized protein YegP (UPF0339 family)